jgi:hypothetical protein
MLHLLLVMLCPLWGLSFKNMGPEGFCRKNFKI